MSEEAIKRYEQTKNKGPTDLAQQESPPPEPVYDKAALAEDEASEPLLGTVQYEKMVYVDDKGIPIAEDSLTAQQIMERAGFASDQYMLYVSPAQQGSKGKPLKEDQKVQIKNNMQLQVIFKPQKSEAI